MNKIEPFFSEISQQTHGKYEKIATIINIWQSQMIFYMHQQYMVSDYCTKYE